MVMQIKSRSQILVEDHLSRGKWIVNPDRGCVFNHRGRRLGYENELGYWVIGIWCPKNQKRYFVREHRVVFYAVHGYWPKVVERLDGDRLNNKITNLRDPNPDRSRN